jgi:PIN domain nuclease of toxin-antitoxin system
VRLLLDTHCWVWWVCEPEKLADSALGIIRDSGNEVCFSAASSWEIAIKCSLGRLKFPEPAERFIPQRLARDGFTALPVEHAHALHVASLPRHHRDPFDRLLIAQAQVEGLPILTADPQFQAYDVEVLPAR